MSFRRRGRHEAKAFRKICVKQNTQKISGFEQMNFDRLKKRYARLGTFDSDICKLHIEGRVDEGLKSC